MRIFLLILILSQVIIAAPSFTCDEDSYRDYLKNYSSKCGDDCDTYISYCSCCKLTYRNHFGDWLRSCLDIKFKAEYRNYPMSFSILSDFGDEDLEKQMNLGVTYSGVGSYTEPEPITFESLTDKNVVARDICVGAEKYSTSNSNSTSWASALIIAAEAALKQAGFNEPLSLPYVLKCLPESLEIEPNEITPSDIAHFVTEVGLIDENIASVLVTNHKDLCSADAPKFYFDVTRNDVPNKSGLMNFMAEGNPVIVLMALNLIRLKTVNNVTEDAIYTGAAEEPSLYGVMKGYDEKKWTVMFNVAPCENIEMNLPIAGNDTSANYAGIAGYAMSIKFKSGTPDIVSFDTEEAIKEIPQNVLDLVFTHSEESTITELTIAYLYLRNLTLEDHTFPYVTSLMLQCPNIQSMFISDNCLSQSPMRRLSDKYRYFSLDTPNLMFMGVGTYSLLNFVAMTVTEISSNFTLELGTHSMSNIAKVEYMVELSMNVIVQIQETIVKNEGHSGTVDLIPLNPVVTATPTPIPEPWFPIYDPFILGDNCNYENAETCIEDIIPELNVTSMYLAIRDAYPTKALAHTRVIALAGVDNDAIGLWKTSLSKQILNIAPIDFYIMNDPVKGRQISTDLALDHLPIVQYTYPRIIFIGDGTLEREGFLQVLEYIVDNSNNGYFKNLEELYIVKNSITSYDIGQEYLTPGYGDALTANITSYLNEMCTDKTYFPNLRLMDFKMNGWNMQGAGTFGEAVINACDNSTGVTISIADSVLQYPVMCMDPDKIESNMKQTFYYDMSDVKDAAQCRFNWNWEATLTYNNDIVGPYPLPDAQHCPGYA